MGRYTSELSTREHLDRVYISLRSAADLFGCSVATVRRMVARGELTGYRVGKRLLRLDRAEVFSLAHPITSMSGGRR